MVHSAAAQASEAEHQRNHLATHECAGFLLY